MVRSKLFILFSETASIENAALITQFKCVRPRASYIRYCYVKVTESYRRQGAVMGNQFKPAETDFRVPHSQSASSCVALHWITIGKIISEEPVLPLFLFLDISMLMNSIKMAHISFKNAPTRIYAKWLPHMSMSLRHFKTFFNDPKGNSKWPCSHE